MRSIQKSHDLWAYFPASSLSLLFHTKNENNPQHQKRLQDAIQRAQFLQPTSRLLSLSGKVQSKEKVMRKQNSPFCSRWLAGFIFLFSASLVSAQEPNDTNVITTPLKIDSIIQHEDSVNLYRINRTYLKSYWTDFKGVASAPFHWKGKNWKTFGLLMGTTGILLAFVDEPAREMILRNRNEFLNSASDVVYPLGNRFPPLLLSGMYLTSIITKDRKLEHSSLSIARSLGISTVFYMAAKSVIRRERTGRTDDPYLFAPPFSRRGYTSFPSGHANTAFSVATAFVMEYKHKKWVPWVAYSVAALTALGRMYEDRHWSSDVLIGSAMGHFITKTIYRLEEKRRGKTRKTVSMH